jgi:hypothetical protein
MNAKIGLKLQVTATPSFHLLYDWCFQTIRLCSDMPEGPEDDIVMEKRGAEALYSAVKCGLHIVQTIDADAQQNVAYWIIQIGKPWTIRGRSESELTTSQCLQRVRVVTGVLNPNNQYNTLLN